MTPEELLELANALIEAKKKDQSKWINRYE
jgi:hypothetical protein